MSSIFGKLFGNKDKETRQPTGFQTLPGFAREGFQQAVEQGRGLGTDVFQPTGFTPEQEQASQFFGQNPFEEVVVQNALQDLQKFGQGQFSDIGTLASEAGGFGGTRQALLESELFKNLQHQAGSLSGGLRSQGFGLNTARNQSLFDIGSARQQQETATQLAPAQQAQFLANLTGAIPAGGGQKGFQPQPGLLQRVNQGIGGQGGLGSSLSGFGAAIGTLSDIRTKENIEKVGREKGFNIYEFNYKSDGSKRYRGVMAQEVLKTRPDAVVNKDGYLAVDYDALGLEMVGV